MAASPFDSDAAWVKHVQTIRRVLMGQWANNDARLKALAALHELEKELHDARNP